MLGRAAPRPTPGFLNLTTLGPVYLVGDGIFVALARTEENQIVHAASLTAHARAFIERLRRWHVPGLGPVGQAREWIQGLPVLRYCLLELIPYLQSLQEADRFPPERPLDVQRVLDDLDLRARELWAQSQQLRTPAPGPSEIVRLFRPPCAIVGSTVAPLQAVEDAAATDVDVAIARARYRICLEKARPLSEVLSELDRKLLHWSQQQRPFDSRQSALATELVGGIHKVLDRYQPVDRGRYRVLYADRHHQVHHTFGRLLLVRGPVRRRNVSGEVWVGLELNGGSRSQLLGSAPKTAANPEMFWKGARALAPGAICMGRPEQYRHLFSKELTDAEAVVLWLDAGVILATGRSAFHRARLAKNPKAVARSPATTVQRTLRRACS